MSYKKLFTFKSGVVNTNTHPTLLIGQVVKIVREEKDTYTVKVSSTSKEEVINKNFVITN